MTLPDAWHIVESSSFHAGDGGCRGTVATDDTVEIKVSLVGWVHPDACHWRGAPEEVDTPAEVIEALASQTGHETSGPTDATLGGYPATMFEFRSTIDIDSTECEGEPYVVMWKTPDAGAGFGESMGPGETVFVYVVDVDGTPLIVAASRDGNATPERLVHLDAVVASVRIER